MVAAPILFDVPQGHVCSESRANARDDGLILLGRELGPSDLSGLAPFSAQPANIVPIEFVKKQTVDRGMEGLHARVIVFAPTDVTGF